MASCYLNIASYRFCYLRCIVCILPVAQHEVKELFAGPKYGTHETCLGLHFSNNSVIAFPMQSCALSPKWVLTSIETVSQEQICFNLTFILYLCELGYGFFQWHLATSLTKHLTFFFFFNRCVRKPSVSYQSLHSKLNEFPVVLCKINSSQ